jgi:hypothetical protein
MWVILGEAAAVLFLFLFSLFLGCLLLASQQFTPQNQQLNE